MIDKAFGLGTLKLPENFTLPSLEKITDYESAVVKAFTGSIMD